MGCVAVGNEIEFGARLRRAIREHYGPNQEREFARQIGMDPTQLSRTLNGKVGKRPEMETLKRYADGLGLSFPEVLGWTLPEVEHVEPAPLRVVVVHGPDGDLEVPIDEVVAYVEAFPDQRQRDRLARWRENYSTPTYQRLCARLYVAWHSNLGLVLGALEESDVP